MAFRESSFHLKHIVFVPPPDELDAVLEREAIERYVTHITNGDRTVWALEGPWTEPRGVKKQEERHWDMETINANWAALYGAAPSAARLVENPSPDSTRPTVRLVASQPPARASGASSTRRSTVTTDNYTYRAANALPNDEPDITTLTVDQLARERGVSKRYAYALMRRAQAAKMDVHIPSNQREMILTILYRSDGYIRNTDDLSEAVHESGSTLPPHDVTKTLWSLQKSQYVKFRERAGGMLYAIKLTPEGKKAAKALIHPVVDDNELLPTIAGTMSTVEMVEEAVASVALDHDPHLQTQVVETNVGPDQQADAYDLVEEHVKRVAANARLLQQEIDELGAGTPEPEPIVPWFRGNLGGWPLIRDVRDRHNKAVKIKSALALLEEVGEDDAVLALLDKITFTPLEEEVVQLLRFLKEIPE